MRVGLLAMSGIRLLDAELLELGFTLPGFVERGKAIASLPSLGLLYLAAVTPQGHQVSYFEAESDRSVPLGVFDCDLVGISTFSAQVFEAYAVADRLRAAGVKVAMGGLHATVLPEEAARHADYVIVGEGENVWPAVVEAAARGAPAAVFRARDFPPVDVDRLPVPRYDLLSDRPYDRFTVQTSRGCPWRCEFCASGVMLSERWRKRPVEAVVRDVEAILAVRPNAFLEFADDNTFVDKEWGKDLCRALAPFHVKWFTETDLTVAEDEDLVDLMRESGCRQVLVGLESPSAEALQGVETRGNRKALWAGRHMEAVRTIQSHGVTVNGCFVLGLDGHTPSVFDDVLRFAEEAPLYDVQITVMTAFPGTPLFDRLRGEGRLLADGRWDRLTLFDVNHRPKGMSGQDLRSGLHRLASELYGEACTDRRRRGFFELVRRGRVRS